MEQATLRAPGRVRAFLTRDHRGALGSLDWGLLVLVALLVLTEAFGRSFSVLGIDAISLYVTEVALLAILVLSLRRHGVGPAMRLVVDRIPAPLLLLLWLSGLIAVLRGLGGFGASMTLHDIGLAEYSILLALVALVVDTTSRSELLTRALAFGGIAALVVYGASEVTARTWGDTTTLGTFIKAAAGMYLSFYVVWVAARLLHRVPVARVHLVVAPLALALVGVTETRSAWVALGGALVSVAVLAPTPLRRTMGIAAAAVAAIVALAVAWSAETQLARQLDNPVVETDAPISRELEGFTGQGSSTEARNTSVRFAFWEELITRSARAPVLGAGFGRPSAFEWEGLKYDFRRGHDAYPTNAGDVTGPHNGFVDVLYRMGVPALAALIGLIGVALWRLRGLWRMGGDRDPDRARRVALVGMFVSTLALVVFTDALRGPYLGMFFWTILGLLLVEGRLAQSGRAMAESKSSSGSELGGARDLMAELKRRLAGKTYLVAAVSLAVAAGAVVLVLALIMEGDPAPEKHVELPAHQRGLPIEVPASTETKLEERGRGAYARLVRALGPSLYWPLGLDGAADSSGNRRHGTPVAGVGLGDAAGVPSADASKATRFDGSNDEISVTDNPFAGDATTVTGWALRSASDTPGALFGVDGDRHGSNVLLAIEPGDGANVDMQFWSNTNKGAAVWSGAWPRDARWQQWALVHRTGNIDELFINGRSLGTRSSAEPGSPTTFRLGAVSGSWFFNGRQQHIAVFPRALNSDEVLSLWKTGSRGVKSVVRP